MVDFLTYFSFEVLFLLYSLDPVHYEVHLLVSGWVFIHSQKAQIVNVAIIALEMESIDRSILFQSLRYCNALFQSEVIVR